MLDIKIPKGYREFRIGEDNAEELHKAGRLGDLCKCGHFRPAHMDIGNRGMCAVGTCDCKYFTWKAWVVKEED